MILLFLLSMKYKQCFIFRISEWMIVLSPDEYIFTSLTSSWHFADFKLKQLLTITRLIRTEPRQLRSSIIKGISVPTNLLHLIPFLFFFFTWYNNFLPNTYFVETINDYVNREWKRLCTRATQCRCRQWKKLYIHVNN